MKKTLAIVLAMALLCIMSVGGTLSYFTDMDGDANTMVVGKVLIDQLERKRDGSTFDESAIKLLPVTNTTTTSVNGYMLLDTKYNAVDKFVTVQNTGTEAAYVRTLFAFEMLKTTNAGGSDEWVDPVATNQVVLNTNIELKPTGIKFAKDDIMYVVYVATYSDPVAAGKVSNPSLLQVYLAHKVDNSFYESISADGKYDILVLSQAVQYKGFEERTAEAALDEAFCVLTAANATEVATWFANVNN